MPKQNLEMRSARPDPNSILKHDLKEASSNELAPRLRVLGPCKGSSQESM